MLATEAAACLPFAKMQPCCQTVIRVVSFLQEQREEAMTLQKAGRIMCNVKLACAWRGWLVVVEQRHYLQDKLGSALNLFVNRRLTLAWQAWKVRSPAPR